MQHTDGEVTDFIVNLDCVLRVHRTCQMSAITIPEQGQDGVANEIGTEEGGLTSTDNDGGGELCAKKKKRKKKKKKKKKNKANPITDVKYKDLDEASDRYLLLKQKHALVRQLLDKHFVAKLELDKLDSVKAKSQRGLVMVNKKKREIMKKMQEYLNGVSAILKEYPEVKQKQHLEHLKGAIQEDMLANDNNRAKHMNQEYNRIMQLNNNAASIQSKS